VVKNAKALAEALIERGLRIVSGRTESHVMLVDLRSKGLTGKEAEAILGQAHMTCNKNGIPNDPQKPFVTSGIRLGSPAFTTRGFKEEDATKVGNLIADVLDNPHDAATIERVKAEVKKLTDKYPVYAASLSATAVAAVSSPGAMKCPFCQHEDTQVLDTRVSEEGDSIRRRRRCAQCDKRFTTYERIELSMPIIVKKNGSRTEFESSKLRGSLMLALRKRPVAAPSAIDAAVASIEEKLLTSGRAKSTPATSANW
jgi:transcriptional regulator NrdR